MPLQIVPFTNEHLDAAAALLAARYRRNRLIERELPVRYEDPTAARGLIQATRGLAAPPAAPAGPRGHFGPATAGNIADAVQGVAAIRDGRVTGYMLGWPMRPSPSLRPRAAGVDAAGHAVDADDGIETYRHLYAALAPRWVADGRFSHYAVVPAADTDALEAFYSLGFGQDQARAVRDTAPVPSSGGASVEVHQAGSEDAAVVAGLMDELARHHAGPPIFLPYLSDYEVENRARTAERLADPESIYFVAYRNGEALGVQLFSPASATARAVTPERCIHLDEGVTAAAARGAGVGSTLLNHALSWARDAGYDRCTVSWVLANPLADRFWRGQGFRPVAYRLVRHIDERIAWAHGGL